MNAAANLFYDRGVEAVSLDDVRSATGTSKSQLYHYFSDKSDLVHAVIECQKERTLNFHRPVLSALSSWEDLQDWRSMIVEFQAARRCRGGCPLGSLVVELVEADNEARSHLARAFEEWEQLLAQGFERMIQRGLLRDDTRAAELAVAVMASLQGGLLLAELEKRTRPLEVALDSAIAHVRTFARESRF
ncbi:MAG: TetR/AcrR family transcriptional regulator [Acidimicrobiales bacterium]